MPDSIHEDWRDEIAALSKRVDWLAQRDSFQEAVAREMKSDIAEIKESIAQLVAIANMGKGALWLVLRVGGFLAVLATIFEALRMARVI